MVEASGNTYACQDLTTLKILKFDVSHLKKFIVQDDTDTTSVAALDKNEFVIHSIIEHVGNPKKKSSMKFKVHWSGYEHDEDTWEPYSVVKDCEALDVYLREHPGLHL